MRATKQLTVRMPIELVNKIERQGGTTSFLIDAAQEKLARDEQAAIEASLACLVDDDEANDISDFAAAQRRVMSRND